MTNVILETLQKKKDCLCKKRDKLRKWLDNTPISKLLTSIQNEREHYQIDPQFRDKAFYTKCKRLDKQTVKYRALVCSYDDKSSWDNLTLLDTQIDELEREIHRFILMSPRLQEIKEELRA